MVEVVLCRCSFVYAAAPLTWNICLQTPVLYSFLLGHRAQRKVWQEIKARKALYGTLRIWILSKSLGCLGKPLFRR